MIKRYSLPEISAVWTEENKYIKWLAVELAACEVWAEQGKVPAEALANIRKKAKFEVARIEEIEKTVDHDVIAFTTALAENIGPDSRFVHLGLTSSDVVDTAGNLLLKDALDIIIKDVEKLLEVISAKAKEHKKTPMAGRTHGIQAEPITFGLKLAIWYDEMKRHKERLEAAKKIISVGKISGAVGTYAHLEPEIEAKICHKLGLEPAKISNQILQRDRHAQVIITLALLGGSLEKFATELRALQRTEIGEVEEPFGKGQKGSSAMPHKKNPILGERICGLARLLRGYALTSLENVALWGERDISHSSNERVIWPDATITADYILRKFTGVIKDLVVHSDKMLDNINRTKGLVFSQKILLALVDKGLTREDAYKIVQENAFRTRDEGIELKELIKKDERVKKAMLEKEIEAIFDINGYLRQVDKIFSRVGLI